MLWGLSSWRTNQRYEHSAYSSSVEAPYSRRSASSPRTAGERSGPGRPLTVRAARRRRPATEPATGSVTPSSSSAPSGSVGPSAASARASSSSVGAARGAKVTASSPRRRGAGPAGGSRSPTSSRKGEGASVWPSSSESRHERYRRSLGRETHVAEQGVAGVAARKLALLQRGDEEVANAPRAHPVGVEHAHPALGRSAPQRDLEVLEQLDQVAESRFRCAGQLADLGEGSGRLRGGAQLDRLRVARGGRAPPVGRSAISRAIWAVSAASSDGRA